MACVVPGRRSWVQLSLIQGLSEDVTAGPGPSKVLRRCRVSSQAPSDFTGLGIRDGSPHNGPESRQRKLLPAFLRPCASGVRHV